MPTINAAGKSKGIKKAPKTRQGVDTAKRMRAKLASFKQKAKDDGPRDKERLLDEGAMGGVHDEEDLYSEEDRRDGLPKDSAVTQDMIKDNFFEMANA